MAELTPCRTPTPGRTGVTNIPAWKYDAVARAIRAALATGPLRQADLPEAVGGHLDADSQARLGSLGWHVTTVRLEMEVRGEVTRLPGRPVRIGLAEAGGDRGEAG